DDDPYDEHQRLKSVEVIPSSDISQASLPSLAVSFTGRDNGKSRSVSSSPVLYATNWGGFSGRGNGMGMSTSLMVTAANTPKVRNQGSSAFHAAVNTAANATINSTNATNTTNNNSTNNASNDQHQEGSSW
ncbi:hypothetical protein BG005_002706, partial [Podila minutissima]